jgi:hypothetical protein
MRQAARYLAHGAAANIPFVRPAMRKVLECIPADIVEWLTPFQAIRKYFSSVSDIPFFAGRESAWEDLFLNHIGDTVPIYLLEFGVYKGASIARFAALNQHADSRFFGFDSFHGLPEDWVPGNPKGHFSTGGREPDIADRRIEFVKGLFSGTLPSFLNRNRDLQNPSYAKVVHFDADLYGSTLFVLVQMWNYFDDYYFVFDEFTGQEALALRDFVRAFGGEIEFFGKTLHVLETPACLTGRIRNSNRLRDDRH